MASTKLTRTHGTATNTKKYTWSGWVKRGLDGTQETLVTTRTSDSNYSRIRFDGSAPLQFEDVISSSTVTNLISNAKFRDLSAWYHVVVRIDYTQASAGDRARMYVNGSEVTYATSTRQSQNGDSFFNSANLHSLGTYNNNNYFGGAMSHVHFCDGYSYGPDSFGETDSTTGAWKIKTSPSVSYGTNGYFVLKDNLGVTDQSGNSNNFTVAGGTLTNLQDCPSDVFATLNPLTRQASLLTLSNGNTTLTTPSSTEFNTATSTLAMSSGKYYFEVKRIAERGLVGITNVKTAKLDTTSQYYNGDTDNSNDYGYYSDDGKVYNNGNPTGSGATWGNGDIVGCAVDLDNRKIYWHKNGTYINSGNPSAGSGGQTIPSDLTYYFAVSGYTSTTFQCNFGNGFFGTTAISSEGSNASGIGKFEYDVPTGYTALSTKGLNE